MVPPTARSVRLEWATTSAVESHPRQIDLLGEEGVVLVGCALTIRGGVRFGHVAMVE